MRIEQTIIEEIRIAFQKMQSVDDFLEVLNSAKTHVYGEKAIPFALKQLTFYSNPKLGRTRYRKFKIKKKSGAERTIHAPVRGLKALQKTLSFVLQCVFEPHEAATGFVWDTSIVDNARCHVENRYVFNIDLKDFFPSVDQARVWKCLQLKPFNLEGSEGKMRIAGMIAGICCASMEVERKNQSGEWEKQNRNVLPQGAPTSPVLTNVVCQRLDFLLAGVAKRFGLTYTRYADDITFSSMHNVYETESDFSKELNRILEQQRFSVKDSKTRLQGDGYRKEVTGLTVNEKVNVSKRYIKRLRLWLYYWERYGYERSTAFFAGQYAADKGHVKKKIPELSMVIAGKLEYLKMVRGEDDGVYRSLSQRFQLLRGKVKDDSKRHIHLNKVIDLMMHEGVDKAMDFFKPKEQ